MRWSLEDQGGKREPCKLQGPADPFESHIIPWTEGFQWNMGVSLWDVPGSGQLQTQSCVTLRDVLLSLCTSDERPCVVQTSRKALAGRREMENAVFVPSALPAAKDEAIC